MMKLFAFIFIITISLSGRAQSLGDNSRSVRSYGMGGVMIPFVKGAESVFYNPAALAKSPLLDIKLLDITIGTNEETISSLEAIQSIDSSDPSTYSALFGKKVWVQAGGKAAVAFPKIALGYLSEYEVSAELHNPTFPQFETYFRNDTATYLGSGFTIMPSTYFGFAVKRISRWGGDTLDLGMSTISNANNLQSIGDSFSNKGQGYGIDMSVMTELPIPFSPTVAVVWQDVGNTAFNKTEGTEAPPHIEQNLTLGAGLSFDLPGLDGAVGAEARHLLDPNIELGKKLHLGAELSLPLVDVRAGYNQGYFTYGVGIGFLIFQLDAAYYTEELGVYPGQTGDSRYMVSLSFDLSFDASFNFTDNSGKKRKLKQRR